MSTFYFQLLGLATVRINQYTADIGYDYISNSNSIANYTSTTVFECLKHCDQNQACIGAVLVNPRNGYFDVCSLKGGLFDRVPNKLVVSYIQSSLLSNSNFSDFMLLKDLDINSKPSGNLLAIEPGFSSSNNYSGSPNTVNSKDTGNLNISSMDITVVVTLIVTLLLLLSVTIYLFIVYTKLNKHLQSKNQGGDDDNSNNYSKSYNSNSTSNNSSLCSTIKMVRESPLFIATLQQMIHSNNNKGI